MQPVSFINSTCPHDLSRLTAVRPGTAGSGGSEPGYGLQKGNGGAVIN